ncbi:hypothetical protein M758_3G080900 [Ceratodon purpureus]|nr:hypothetical protein M758_3G080900 [Ceratodon purpureus]
MGSQISRAAVINTGSTYMTFQSRCDCELFDLDKWLHAEPPYLQSFETEPGIFCSHRSVNSFSPQSRSPCTTWVHTTKSAARCFKLSTRSPAQTKSLQGVQPLEYYHMIEPSWLVYP